MTTEAMTKLSHLIRSKDVEIEALKAKNESLINILRDGDQTAELSNRVESLFTENEKLSTSIRELKEENEKIKDCCFN